MVIGSYHPGDFPLALGLKEARQILQRSFGTDKLGGCVAKIILRREDVVRTFPYAAI
jgi:hypothetical protein